VTRFAGCCPALKMPMKAALVLPMWGCGKAPPRWCGAGLCGVVPVVVGEVPGLCVGEFGDGGAGGCFVDDGFGGGVGGDEGRREPVTRDDQGRPLCANCFITDPANLETCTGCGRRRPVERRTPAPVRWTLP